MVPPDTSHDAVAYVDGNYVRWNVTERDARADPGARGARCLVFAAACAVRRVWDYPPSWRALAADALIALSWRR